MPCAYCCRRHHLSDAQVFRRQGDIRAQIHVLAYLFMQEQAHIPASITYRFDMAVFEVPDMQCSSAAFIDT